jgi:hypothetical protein
LTQENWFDARCFKALPAVPELSDFDDRQVSVAFSFN